MRATIFIATAFVIVMRIITVAVIIFFIVLIVSFFHFAGFGVVVRQ
jgi:hypothetical protein